MARTIESVRTSRSKTALMGATAFVSTALLASASSSAFDSATVIAEVEESIKDAASIVWFGPLTDANVTTAEQGSGLAVTVSGAKMADFELPDILFDVSERGDGNWTISNGRVAEDIGIVLSSSKQVALTLEGLQWSSVYAPATNGIAGYEVAYDNVAIRVGNAGGGSTRASKITQTERDPATGMVEGTFSFGGFDVDLNLVDSLFDGIFPDDLPEEDRKIKYRFGDMAGTSKMRVGESYSPFAAIREGAKIAVAGEDLVENVKRRETLALGFIDSLFQPIHEIDYTSSIDGMEMRQPSEDGVMDIALQNATGDGRYFSDGDDSYSMTTNGAANIYTVRAETTQGPSFEVDLATVSQEAGIGNFRPKMLKSALQQLVVDARDGLPDAPPESVFDALRALGGGFVNQRAEDIVVAMLVPGGDGEFLKNPVAEVGAVDAKFALQAPLEEPIGDLGFYSQYAIGIENVASPFMAMAPVPPEVIPTAVNIDLAMAHGDLWKIVDNIGKENLVDFDPAENPEDFKRLIKAFIDEPPKLLMDLAAKGEGYAFNADLEAEAYLTEDFDPSDPVFAGEGRLVMRGLDDIRNVLLSMAQGDVPDQIRQGAMGAIGGIGFLQGFGQPGEGSEEGALIYDIQIDFPNSVSLNGIPLPIPF